SQLPGNFRCGQHVYFHGGILLVLRLIGTVATVDVNDVQGFRMLNDQIGSPAHRSGSSKGGLDLPFDPKFFEDGDRTGVLLYYGFLFRGNFMHVILDLIVEGLIIDMNPGKGVVEYIPKYG